MRPSPCTAARVTCTHQHSQLTTDTSPLWTFRPTRLPETLLNIWDLNRSRPRSDVVPLWLGPSPIRLPALLPFLRSDQTKRLPHISLKAYRKHFGLALIDSVHSEATTGTTHRQATAPLAVTTRIASEVQWGCLVGPLPESFVSLVHVSLIGMVPKPHSNNFRMPISAPWV